jgi:hypothetical protein
LQRAVEEALQEGLSRYERSAGRAQFKTPEAKLAKAIERAETDQKTGDARPAWQRALTHTRLPLYDVHWEPAVVVEKPAGKHGEALRVGLIDGRVVPLGIAAAAQRKLAPYDVVLVRVAEGKGGVRAELRVRPPLKSGRMAGLSRRHAFQRAVPCLSKATCSSLAIEPFPSRLSEFPFFREISRLSPDHGGRAKARAAARR